MEHATSRSLLCRGTLYQPSAQDQEHGLVYVGALGLATHSPTLAASCSVLLDTWYHLFSELIYEEGAGILSVPLGCSFYWTAPGVWLDDPQMHSKPLSQGGSLLSSFLVLVWWLLVLGMYPASSLMTLVLLWPLLNLIVHFMCNEGRLHSGLSWVSMEPSLGWWL